MGYRMNSIGIEAVVVIYAQMFAPHIVATVAGLTAAVMNKAVIGAAVNRAFALYSA